jgi:hypothetical protein
MVDYRDRISVMSWTALFILAIGSLLSWPAKVFTWQMLGSPITLRIDQTVILSVLLAIVASSGTEAVMRSHPLALRGQLSHTWVHWGLPGSVLVLAELLIPVAPSRLYVIGVILTAGLLLAVAEIGAYHTADRSDPHYHLARVALNAVVYAVTLVLFLLVYRTRARSLISATLVTVVSTLLALELLRGSQRSLRDVLLYALVTGAILGEATWALNYWRTTGYKASLVLLLIFYLVVSLGQQSLLGRLTRRILLEYAIVTLAVITFIVLVAP